MKKLIKNVDFLGLTPSFLYNGNFTHKSILGGIISIITAVLTILSFGYFTTIFLSKSNFTIYESLSRNSNSMRYWKSDEFSIIVVNRYFELIPEIERILTITANSFTNNKDQSIPLEKCNLTNSEHKLLWGKESFIERSLCFSKSLDKANLNITGEYGANNSVSIFIWISLCSNSTVGKKGICFDFQKSKELLDNAFVIIKFLDYYYIHESEKNVYVPYIYSEPIEISSSVYKRLFYKFQNTKYLTDTSIITGSNMYEEHALISSQSSLIDIRTTPTVENAVFSVSLHMIDKEKTIVRKYYKFQTLCADIGGLIKVIFTLGQTLNYICNSNIYFFKLINENIDNYFQNGKDNLHKFRSHSKNNSCVTPKDTIHPHFLRSNNFLTASYIFNCNINQQAKSKTNSINESFSKVIKTNNNNTPNKSEQAVDKMNNSDSVMNVNLKRMTTNSEKNSKLTFNNTLKKLELDHCFWYCNPCLFIMPSKYKNSTNKKIRLVSRLEAILFKQLDISSFIRMCNLFDKVVYCFIGVNNLHEFEKSFNPLLLQKESPIEDKKISFG